MAIYLETNDTVSAASLGTLLVEVERLALNSRHFGRKAEVRVLDIGIGSTWTKIGIFFAGVAAGSAVWSANSAQKSADAAMAQLQLSVEERANRSNSYLGQCLAEMYLDSSVVKADITISSGQRFIKMSELPAVPYVELRRLAPASTMGIADRRSVELPVHGRVGIHDEKYIDAPKVERGERLQKPIRDGDSFVYKGGWDERGARSYLGRFARGDNDTVLFNHEGGNQFGVLWDEDLLEHLGEIPFDDRVMVRAQFDRDNMSAVIFEFFVIELP